MTNRPGATSIAELLLVAALFGIVLTGLATVATGQGRLAAVQVERTRVQELSRTARVILSAELRHGLGAQVVAAAGDSVRLRAVRGAGVICGMEGGDLVVRYRGVRRPEPDKDSVLVLGSSGVRVAGALEGVAGVDSCGGALQLRVERPPGGPDGLVLVYESGTYMVAGGAVRYRRGAAGRQPLTEAILNGSEPGSDLEFLGDRLRLGLVPHHDSLPRSQPGPLEVAIPHLNGVGAP